MRRRVPFSLLTCPTPSPTASRCARTAWRSASRWIRRVSACWVSPTSRSRRHGWHGCSSAGSSGRGLRILDRIAPPAPELINGGLSTWTLQQRGSGGSVRDGAGRHADRGSLSRRSPHYKAPPPEVSSEAFYETHPRAGLRCGLSIQTVSPLPIGWAEHVLAEGHWGRALREYMRDYNHWQLWVSSTSRSLTLTEPACTLADERDAVRAAGREVRLHALRERQGQYGRSQLE